MPSFLAPYFLFISIFLNYTFIVEPLLTCKMLKKIQWVVYVLTGILILNFWREFDFSDYFTIFFFLYIYFCMQISI
jgi:hypothetical protein